MSYRMAKSACAIRTLTLGSFVTASNKGRVREWHREVLVELVIDDSHGVTGAAARARTPRRSARCRTTRFRPVTREHELKHLISFACPGIGNARRVADTHPHVPQLP